MALVSIIIPCYNAVRFVAAAIQSALDQTHQNCEVIVIDDGSTDGSLEVIKSFGNKIRWETRSNSGAGAARNRGIELAQGQYIQFLDADDFISPNKIKQQLLALGCEQDSAIASCSHCYCSLDGIPENYTRLPVWKSYSTGIDLLIDMWNSKGAFPIHAWLTPKVVIDRIGIWNPSLSSDDDGEFFGRVLLSKIKVVFVEYAQAYYRRPDQHNVSSQRKGKNIKSFFDVWDFLQIRILSQRNDTEARLAVLRRLRAITYFYANDHSEWVYWAGQREKAYWKYDWKLPIPRMSSFLIGTFGLVRGLSLRRKGIRLVHLFTGASS